MGRRTEEKGRKGTLGERFANLLPRFSDGEKKKKKGEGKRGELNGEEFVLATDCTKVSLRLGKKGEEVRERKRRKGGRQRKKCRGNTLLMQSVPPQHPKNEKRRGNGGRKEEGREGQTRKIDRD